MWRRGEHSKRATVYRSAPINSTSTNPDVLVDTSSTKDVGERSQAKSLGPYQTVAGSPESYIPLLLERWSPDVTMLLKPPCWATKGHQFVVSQRSSILRHKGRQTTQVELRTKRSTINRQRLNTNRTGRPCRENLTPTLANRTPKRVSMWGRHPTSWHVAQPQTLKMLYKTAVSFGGKSVDLSSCWLAVLSHGFCTVLHCQGFWSRNQSGPFLSKIILTTSRLCSSIWSSFGAPQQRSLNTTHRSILALSWTPETKPRMEPKRSACVL